MCKVIQQTLPQKETDPRVVILHVFIGGMESLNSPFDFGVSVNWGHLNRVNCDNIAEDSQNL